MNRKILLGTIAVVVLVALGVGAAYYTGVGPAPGGSDSGDSLDEFPTQTASEPDDSETETTVATDGTVTDETTTPPFTFSIDEIAECGTTCRDVTATLTNEQTTTATGVTVYTRVYAGEDNTAEEDVVWEGSEDVGTIEGGESHTDTRRVELSLRDARKVDQNDGWVTIVTTVQTDDQTVTFRDSEQMA
ncbi:MAG: hypothetical protein ACOCPT_04965 [Halanaeroarchaeum sp.]